LLFFSQLPHNKGQKLRNAFTYVYHKVTFTPVQTTKAQKGSRGIALLFL
jgi:hypothetical protein